MADDDDLRVSIAAARPRAQLIGPMHAHWDVIMDAESFLAGKRTLVDWGPRSQVAKRMIDALAEIV